MISPKNANKPIKHKIILTLLQKGECFGEEEILSFSNRKYSSYVKSIECKILMIKKEKFLEIYNFEKKKWNIGFFFENKKNLHEKILKENTELFIKTEENKEDEGKDDKRIKIENMKNFFHENKDYLKHLKMTHIKADEKTKEKIKLRIETDFDQKKRLLTQKLLKNYEISPILKYSAVNFFFSCI